MLKVDAIDVFYGDAQALDGVSLQVHEGEIVTLVGSNGAGKTTTLRTLSGLLRPRKGAITIGGTRLDKTPAHKIVSLGVAHVPEGRCLFPQMSVWENLTLGAYNTSAWNDREEVMERVFRLFPVLKARSTQLSGTLSGGEQQMCAIGRALMARPKLLMLDEPSLGLAPNLVEMIFQVIAEINQSGITVLLVEQNAYLALQMADRAYVLENGRVTLSGPGQEVAANENVRQAYLGL
jgi:branched-chain amino acid transport system ATP-binding protein